MGNLCNITKFHPTHPHLLACWQFQLDCVFGTLYFVERRGINRKSQYWVWPQLSTLVPNATLSVCKAEMQGSFPKRWPYSSPAWGMQKHSHTPLPTPMPGPELGWEAPFCGTAVLISTFCYFHLHNMSVNSFEFLMKKKLWEGKPDKTGLLSVIHPV